MVTPYSGALALGAAATLLFAAAPARAQDRVLTWAEVVRLVEEHPRIREAAARTQAASAAVAAAGALPNPSLDIGIARGAPTAGSGPSRLEQEYEVAIPLDWIAVRGPRIDEARATEDAAHSEARALRREVLSKLGSLFWNVAYGQDRVGSLTDLESQTAELSRLVRARVEKGEARPIELARVETELERARNELAGASATLDSSRAQLALWLPSLATTPWHIEVREFEAMPALRSEQDAIEGVAQHPALEATRARVRALDASASLERRQRVPALSIKGFIADELDRRAVGVGVGVTLPVWNWNTGRIDQAEASRAAEESRLDAQRRELLAEAIEARRSCVASQQAVARYRERILPSAQAATTMLEKSYQVGETNLLDVLDGRRVLGETRRAYLTTLLQMQLDCSRLQLLLGEPQ